MPEVQLIARHTIAAGKVDEVLPLLPRPVQAALTEPGCLAFEVFRRLDDEHSYVLLERYASRAALDAHRQTAHFKDLVLGQIVPRLSSRVLETSTRPSNAAGQPTPLAGAYQGGRREC